MSSPGKNTASLKDERLDRILEALIQMAGQDFLVQLPISDNRDEIDAISLSVNMLGEELIATMKELEANRAQVVQSAKLASLGEMASGLSHELNNPLFLLMGFNELVNEILKSDFPGAYKAVKEHLAEIDSNGIRIKKIINHMREFSRQSKGDLELVDLNEIVLRSFTLLNEQLSLKMIDTKFYLSETPIPVMVDRIQMEQVFMNLITNARDAIEEKGAAQGRQIVTSTAMEEGKAHVVFQDNGCGMDEETKAKVFDAFFTTKEIGKGTGLGMSVSFGILETFHANIECDSSPGEGTTFRISLPLAENPKENIV